MSQAYLRDYADKLKITESDIETAYRDYLRDYDAKEYHVRQILLKDEAEARNMIAELERGADFAELAKAHSIDPGAAQTGGDIGWFRPDVFIDKRLSAAVEQLTAGEYSRQPVRTRFGWHVIKIEEGPRDVKFPRYSELSDEWKKKMRERALMKKVSAHVESLIDTAKVRVLDDSKG